MICPEGFVCIPVSVLFVLAGVAIAYIAYGFYQLFKLFVEPKQEVKQ